MSRWTSNSKKRIQKAAEKKAMKHGQYGSAMMVASYSSASVYDEDFPFRSMQNTRDEEMDHDQNRLSEVSHKRSRKGIDFSTFNTSFPNRCVQG